MTQLNYGRLLLRSATHVLLACLKQVPGVGMAAELVQGGHRILRDELHRANVKERLQQIEEAAAITAAEARQIALEVIAEQRRQGTVIEGEKAEAVCDLIMFMPATIKEQTAATIRQARRNNTALTEALPITEQHSEREQDSFYESLLPSRRPRFQSGDSVPGANVGWRLGEFIGAGGFGEVWTVRHEYFQYAVKFCLDAASAQILRGEAKALGTLYQQLPHHANIVRLAELNLQVEPYWLAFEFIEGGTLEALLRAKTLTWQESVALFRPIVEGVAAVHRIGIIHRDLKPANILLTNDGVPKIADFGIGKVVAENVTVMDATRTRRTTQGFGSLGYMSPEQSEGKPAHPSDDTYALGVLLWQMLTHWLKTPTFQELMAVQQLDVPASLKTLVFECLSKSREERPQDGAAVLALLPNDVEHSLQDELTALNQQLADLQAREAQAAQHNEAAQQRELERERIAKQQEVTRKQREVEAEQERQWIYTQANQKDDAKQAQISTQTEERLAELRKLVEQKRQRSGAPQQLQQAINELKQVDALIEKTEADYEQELKTQHDKLEQGLQTALAELGEFETAPRDRFEKKGEYEQRVEFEQAEYHAQQQKIQTSWQTAQQQQAEKLETARQHDLAELQKQRTALLQQRFDVPPKQLQLQLLDYDVDAELLTYEVIAEEVLAGQCFRSKNAKVAIERDAAKTCWHNRDLLIAYMFLGLETDAKPKLLEVGFETADGKRFCAAAGLKIEESEKERDAQRAKKLKHIYGMPFQQLQALQKDTAQALGLSVTFRDKLRDGGEGPLMSVIPAGIFKMGSNKYDREKPIHKVIISQPFAMGVYQVTFDDYAQLLVAQGRMRTVLKGGVLGLGGKEMQEADLPYDRGWGHGTRPVINISWYDAIAYCEWLSEQTGKHYRLPTEAEWEYACRAGSEGEYCFGSDTTQLKYYAWYNNNSGNQTHPVGEKKANAWGLYDVHGNVWEWCNDWYDDDYYVQCANSGTVTDPINANRGVYRILRGGSWRYYAVYARSAYRRKDKPDNQSNYIGFRLIRD